MRKHRSASGITAFNSMIYAAGGKLTLDRNIIFFKLNFVSLFKATMGIVFSNQLSVMILKMVISRKF